MISLELDGNPITRRGIEAVCATIGPHLVYIGLTGTGLEDAVEGYGVDPMSGQVDPAGAYLEGLGKELARTFGDQPWVHAPTRLHQYALDEQELALT